MGFNVPTRTFEIVYQALLLVSAFGWSTTSECNDFNMKNVNGDRGDWSFYRSSDSTECFLCFRRAMGNSQHPELALPCMPIKGQVQIFYRYQFRPTQDSEPLSIDGEGTSCQDDYNSATDISHVNSTIRRLNLSRLASEQTLVKDLDPTISYRLKTQTTMGENPNGLIVCLTNVTFKQRQSMFPIWVIFVIIAIVIISICAVAGVFIRRRKQHDHQPANNVNTGSANGKSNGIKDNMKNDKDVIANPTYGQEPVNGKEEEYHSYTEIDVKIPGNSEMIYNSAYESQSASSDMVYNSAYESPPASSDMVYNSAYESSPSS